MNINKCLVMAVFMFFGIFGLVKSSRAACTPYNGTTCHSFTDADGKTITPQWCALTPDSATIQNCAEGANWGDKIAIAANSSDNPANWSSGIWSSSLSFYGGYPAGRTYVLPPSGEAAFSYSVDDNALANSFFTNTTLTGGVPAKKWPIRVSNFTFNLSTETPAIKIGASTTSKILTGWRFDHNNFNISSGSAVPIWVYSGISFGLIDNCTFTGVGSGWGQIEVDNWLDSEYNAFPALLGDTAANRPANLGTDEAVYIEDCTFTFNSNDESAAANSSYGGNIVLRYNHINGTYFQTHSTMNNRRAGIKSEVYNNVFNGTCQACPNGQFIWPIFLRSGVGVVFNNQISEYRRNIINIDNERSYEGWGYLGLCNGGESQDGNISANGWPCLDQPGWAGTKTSQTNMPIYAWNNGPQADCTTTQSTCDGSTPFVVTNNTGAYIKTCGDSSPHPGTSSTCGAGTYPVEYVQNGKTPMPGYTPYAYPHPLRGGPTDITPPAAPRGLSVN